jgi:hypothetical protein
MSEGGRGKREARSGIFMHHIPKFLNSKFLNLSLKKACCSSEPQILYTLTRPLHLPIEFPIEAVVEHLAAYPGP